MEGLVEVNYPKGEEMKKATINEADRKRFMQEITLSTTSMRKMKREHKEGGIGEFKKPSNYAKISNKFLSRFSNNLVERGHYLSLGVNLRRANMPFILNTYVSMMLFSTLLMSFLACILFAFLMFFSLTIQFPFIVSLREMTSTRLFENLLASLAVPALTYLSFLYYPYTEKQTIRGKIDQELPFATMHMSAVAGSGIEPSQIFKIIALGREYPHTRQEIKKVINQVNIYGYDLVSALKNSAKSTSSLKLAELFNGMATTISSGGSLTEFLDKRTETLMFDYRLEREKSTKTAETFMDIYISVVIAAPMIMMLLLVLMSVSCISLGLSLEALTIVIVSVVALINLVFIVALHFKQPGY